MLGTECQTDTQTSTQEKITYSIDDERKLREDLIEYHPIVESIQYTPIINEVKARLLSDITYSSKDLDTNQLANKFVKIIFGAAFRSEHINIALEQKEEILAIGEDLLNMLVDKTKLGSIQHDKKIIFQLQLVGCLQYILSYR